MTNFDDLLQQFPSQETDSNQGFTFFDAHPQQQKPTPEEKDLERLEDEIQGIFASRQRLNQAIATFLGVVGSGTGIHLFARLGIPAIATGTIAGIIIALVFGNVLTKIRIEQGRATVDGEFFLALSQALGVIGSMWMGSSSYRELSDMARTGKSQFLTEVKDFEVKPPSPDFGRLGLAGIGVVLLLVALALLRGGKRNGY
jgi:hypothetical protein